MLLDLLAVICAGLFAGAAVYVSLVEHPARLEEGTDLAVREFRPSYRRGAVMQATLVGMAFVLGVAAWARGGHGPAWLTAALLLGAMIPYTLVVVKPVNTRLQDPTLSTASAEAAGLLVRWGRLHAVRAVAGVLAFVIMAARLAGLAR